MSLTRSWTWEFDVPREALWQYLADTDWVNEHAKLPRIAARFEPQPGGGTRRFGSFKQGPFVVEWEERPTIWQVPEFFAVERRYVRGPLRRFLNRTALEALGPARTRVVVDIELQQSSPLFAPLLPLLAAHGKRGADRAFALAAQLAARDLAQSGGDGTAGDEAATQSTATLAKFAPAIAAGADPVAVGALAAHIDASEDRDLTRMRPYELADRRHLPRREMLRAFLTATRAGILNMRWSVICPGCRGPSPGIESLAELQRGYHCPACNVPFDAVFDRSVEVTFDARPLGRGTETGLFCLASPQRSAHVFAQCLAAPLQTQALALALPAGTYDVNAVGVGLAPFVASADETARDFAASLLASGTIEAPHAVGSGDVHVTIDNALDREVLVRVEEGRWPDTIATAAHVTALQEFRDLFSSQVLAPGLELGIETIAVLFTDLVGSTAMYSKTGDAPAFRLVTDHFDVLRDVVARYEGAIVKTIGDAVMAVFVDPAKCLAAALELDGNVRHLEYDGMPLRLRVGFHAGPCIAMRANDRVDYFGTTVNLAARLQSLAHAGEVTMAQTDARRPDVAAGLHGLAATVSHETVAIKGFPTPVDVVRVAGRAGATAA